MINTDIIVVLGGGLLYENGVWRTTRFNEKGDTFGALGDRLRVEAAALLYQENPDAVLIASGGKGQLKDNSDAPTISSVIKKELIELGVPAARIIEEDVSGNTWQQLQQLKALIQQRSARSVLIISNEWHLPRVKAMIEKDSAIEILQCVSAEEILIERDAARWKSFIAMAYQSDDIRKRIELEMKGVEDIRKGTYRLS